MYSILDDNDYAKITNKVHKAFIEFKEVHDALFQKKIFRHKMRGTKSKNHNLGIYEANKTSLSYCDNKRYIFRNAINTIAYGHTDISLMKKE